MLEKSRVESLVIYVSREIVGQKCLGVVGGVWRGDAVGEQEVGDLGDQGDQKFEFQEVLEKLLRVRGFEYGGQVRVTHIGVAKGSSVQLKIRLC